MRKAKNQQEFPWKTWTRATIETMVLPFHLTLEDTHHPLVCEKILRIIPKKRCVAQGTWGDKSIVAKFFYGRDAKRHFKNELNGSNILKQANVPSPQLLYQGSVHKKRIHIILFEKIEESASLEFIWKNRHVYLDVDNVINSFIIELATQHVLGIMQHDLHLNNFLVTEKRIYTLDGSTITQSEGPLDKKNSLENLGLFFSQLGAGTESLQQALFATYVKARGWLVKKSDIDILNTAITTFSQNRWRDYRKKIFRHCTAFKKINTWFQRGMYDRQYQSPDFLSVLHQPDRIFLDPQTKILKNGRSATVAKIMIDNRSFVIKRYNLKDGFHWLRRCLRHTRARESWRLAQYLHLFGVPTAKPIAYIEKHFFGLNSTSYFLMEYLPGCASGEFFNTYQSDNPQYEQVAQRIMHLLNSLNELYVTHGDLKQTNIIIHNNQPALIDLDGMSEHRLSNSLKRAHKKEVQRFMRNWERQPEVLELFEKVSS